MTAPGHLRFTRPTGDARVSQITIRWWHPGAWGLLVRAVLRKFNVLPELCPTCAGHGRLMRRRGFRRQACIACRGTGYKRETGRT